MIIDLPSSTTSEVNRKLVEVREQGGAVALGRVLTLVIVTDDGVRAEEVVDAANDASREHPCRVIVVARGARRAAPRLDAQIRVGGDAGASEVIVLRLYGPLADEGASCVVPLLLPDAPVVAWWPFEGPPVPAKDPIGELAQRRITDAANERNPTKALEQRRKAYADGDTDFAWTRLTRWRALLSSALDLPPYEEVSKAAVVGEGDSPSTDLLAAWLAAYLGIPVRRGKATSGEGIVSVVLDRPSGKVELVRPNGHIGTLAQPGQPDRQVALQRRGISECLAEELRQLDPDEVYENTLQALANVVRGRVAGATPTATKKDSATDNKAQAPSAKRAKKGSATESRTEKPAPQADAEPSSTPPSAEHVEATEQKPMSASSDETQTAKVGT